ncbi:rCG38672, isoform CRA_b [Rattus norvegicus]|uniref:RCG38672, isoform CRA_b n=1 Tax=Rattus norvegicus TaxID=10116 RepID=A6K9T8_RAT|nr:rCG38672, isoform CRA_b [Rattus norvegicus]
MADASSLSLQLLAALREEEARPFGLWAIALDLSHLSPEDTTCGGCRKPRLALGIAQNWQRH